MRVSHGWGLVARVICLVIALGLIIGAPALAERVINTIKVADLSDRVEITVSANTTPHFNPRPSSKGDYICFAFPGRASVKGRYIGIRSGGIHGVRYGMYTDHPPVTRVVVNTARSLNYSTSWSSDKLTVVITVWKHGVKPAPAKVAAEVKPVLEKAVESPSPVEAAVVQPVEKAQIKTAELPKPIVNLPPPTPFVRRNVEQKGSDSGEPVRVALQTVAPPAVNEPTPLTRVASSVKNTVSAVRNISLDFIAADINDVMKALSVQSGTNIVCGADVKGNVTVSLNKVSVEEALDYVAKLSGYKYARDGDTYLIGSNAGVGSIVGSAAVSEDVVSEAACVRHCDAKALQAVLEKQFPELRISGNFGDEKDSKKPGPKLLAFVGPKSLVDQAAALVDKVENAFQRQSEGRTVEIYEAKYACAKELVAMLNEVIPQVYATLGAVDGFKISAPGAVNIDGNKGATVEKTAAPVEDGLGCQKIILTGLPEDIKRALDILARTDVKLPQVLIEAKVTDIGLNAEKRVGVQWSWSDIVTAQNASSLDVVGTPTDTTMKFHHLPANITAHIDAMFKDGTAKLLANPHITTVEGKPAIFFVGDEIKYIINITSTDNGVTISTDTAKVGIQLRVAADISPNNDITLNLHPEVSVITDWIRTSLEGGTNTVSSGIALPQIARRFTDQVIRVKDGESVVIGGLIKENEINNMTKVPLLGDLPFFGNFFRHKQKTREKSEIVIFLKASIVE